MAQERGSSIDFSNAPSISARMAVKPQRVLACMQCQQRKVKCDRKLPCAHCVKAGAQCMPASHVPRQRRRRFPERELLDRLRHYESLLRQNHVHFEPMHNAAGDKASPGDDNHESGDDAISEERTAGTDRSSRETTVIKSETVFEAKDMWHVINAMSGEQEDNGQEDSDGEDQFVKDLQGRDFVKAISKIWDGLGPHSDFLLFGSRRANIELSTLHPDQVQIFRLWQIYLENVDPLLKITHTATLQTRIINAAVNVANATPALEALMFSIYCIATLSVPDQECEAVFGSGKRDLLANYLFGCQQALLNCSLLRSKDRDCLAALLLYLISMRPDTDPMSMNSLLGVALRLAQRMGIQSESSYSKCTALEAEMSRRLWWSFVLFDNRICEMSDHKVTMLVPTWDCKIPLNVNDHDIRPEMKTAPMNHEKPTEALFVVVRSELNDFIRHSDIHLDFTNPALKGIAQDTQVGPGRDADPLAAMEKMMEHKYLQYCNPENPLHFLTLCVTRGHFAKLRLWEHYARYARIATPPSDAERDKAILFGITILDYDNQAMESPLTKGFRWFMDLHFPLPVYIHMLQDLKRRPLQIHGDKCWEAMGMNYEIRSFIRRQDKNPFFRFFAKIVLAAWEPRETLAEKENTPLHVPRMVSSIRNSWQKEVEEAANGSQSNSSSMGTPGGSSVGGGSMSMMNLDDFPMPMPMMGSFAAPGHAFDMMGGGGGGDQQQPYTGWGHSGGLNPSAVGQESIYPDVNQLDLTNLDWSAMGTRS
ncbi:hypothetical protein MMC25_005090 [Agyrium rufum]|nr:hypothetical protein [Agyrium rufum]